MGGHTGSANIAVQGFGATAQRCKGGWHEIDTSYYSMDAVETQIPRHCSANFVGRMV
jgi:hypothetical protein